MTAESRFFLCCFPQFSLTCLVCDRALDRALSIMSHLKTVPTIDKPVEVVVANSFYTIIFFRFLTICLSASLRSVPHPCSSFS